MATGNVPDGERHRQYGQAKGKRDTDETNAEVRKRSSKYRAATASEDQSKRAQKFCTVRFHLIPYGI